MKVLITGAGGFVGRNLSESEILNKNHLTTYMTSRNSLGYHCDLTNQLAVDHLIQTLSPDVIVNCASHASPQPTLENVRSIIDNNSKITFNLITSAMDQNPDVHFINLSSIVVYGDSTDVLNENMGCYPSSIYGSSKLMCEQIVREFGSFYTNLRCSAIISEKYLTHGVVKAFKERILKEPTFWAIGNRPGALKPYLYIDDLASAIDLIIHNHITGNLNVCPDDSCYIEDVAKSVMEAYNIHKEIEWRPDLKWRGDNQVILASNNLLRSYGWEPQYSSKEAIKASCKA